MALYLGSTGKRKVVLDGVVYCLNFFSTTPLTSNAMLFSYDGYALKDANGLYLTIDEDELYLTVKEDD